MRIRNDKCICVMVVTSLHNLYYVLMYYSFQRVSNIKVMELEPKLILPIEISFSLNMRNIELVAKESFIYVRYESSFRKRVPTKSPFLAQLDSRPTCRKVSTTFAFRKRFAKYQKIYPYI